MRRWLEGAVVALAVGLSLLSAAPWTRAFPTGQARALLLLASVVSVVVPVVVVRVLRRPVLWSAAPSLVLLVLVLLVLVVGRLTGFAEIARGLTDGPARLRSTTLPITTTGEYFVVPFVLTWLVGSIIGELTMRTATRAAPGVVALVGFAVAYGMSTGGEGDELVAAALLLGVAALFVCVRAWLERPPMPESTDAEAGVEGRGDAPAPFAAASVVSAFSLGYGRTADPFDATEPRRSAGAPRWRRRARLGPGALATRPLRTGAAAALVTVVATAWIVPNLEHFQQPPTVPVRVPPVERDQVLAPLATTAALRRGEAGVPSTSVLFTMSTAGASAGYVATSQLDAYDGAAWRYDRTFEPTGGRVPDDATVIGSSPVRQRYELRALPSVRGGPALPYIPRPAQLSGLDVRYDAGTGMVLPADAVQEGTTYGVESDSAPVALSGVDPEKLNADGTFPVVAPSPANQDYAYPPELDEDLDRWATSVARETSAAKGATVPFLAAMERQFHTGYARVEEGPADAPAPRAGSAGDPATTLAPGAPPTTAPVPNATGGTSFAEVAGAIGVDRAGTPEQFATLYALIARRLGVPARVVTGFKLPAEAAHDPSIDRLDVRAASAWTWVEVPVTSVGWVPVDPTPTATVAPPEDRVSAETPTTTVPRQTRTAAVAADTGTPIAPPGDLTQAPGPGAGRSPWVIALVLLLVGALAVPVGRRVRRVLRRRRRQRGTPTERIVGAWRDTLDVVRRVPVEDLDSLTNTEVAEAVSRIDPAAGAAVLRLAALGNRALFRAEPLPPAAADAAWADAAVARAALRRHTGLRGRLLDGRRGGADDSSPGPSGRDAGGAGGAGGGAGGDTGGGAAAGEPAATAAQAARAGAWA